MSYWLCPRAAAQPLLGLAARASLPTRSAPVPSREALRWLSQSVARPASHNTPRSALRNGTRPRCMATTTPTTQGLKGSFDRRTFFSRRVAKKYEQLPANYRDEYGLDFRTTLLTQEEVDRVFGRSTIDVGDANALLKILHGRRVAGTLEDPAFATNTERFSNKEIDTALEYLRITVPVDEELSAGLRAEEELAQIEKEEEMREKGITPTEDSTPQSGLAKKLYKVDPVYGASRFDQIRAKNEARSEAKEAARKARQRAEEEAAGGAEALARAKAGPVALIKEDGGAIVNPKIAEYYKKAEQEGDLEPELITFWQRILPSVTVATLVIGFLAAVTTVYEEPADNYRMIRSLSTGQATVCALIGANVLAFMAWRVPPLWGFMNRYMVFIVGKVKPVTLLTANFSHQGSKHLLMNMLALYFVGNALHEEMDRATFLTLYMACGAAGYLSSLMVYTARGWLSVSSLGASGCTLGIMTAYLWRHKSDGFKFFGMPEEGVHGIVFLALLVAIQLSYFGRAVRRKVDLANHFGGMTMGLVGMEIVQRRRFERGQGEVKNDGIIRGTKKIEVSSEAKKAVEPEVKNEEKSWLNGLGRLAKKAVGKGEEK